MIVPIWAKIKVSSAENVYGTFCYCDKFRLENQRKLSLKIINSESKRGLIFDNALI